MYKYSNHQKVKNMSKILLGLTLVTIIMLIVGLLAKLNHWNNASLFITVGTIGGCLLAISIVVYILLRIGNKR